MNGKHDKNASQFSIFFQKPKFFLPYHVKVLRKTTKNHYKHMERSNYNNHIQGDDMDKDEEVKAKDKQQKDDIGEMDLSSLVSNFEAGVIFKEKKKYNKALSHLAKALEEDPENPLVYLELANVDTELGRYESAGKYLDIAQEKFNDNIHVKTQYEKVREILDMLDRAEEQVRNGTIQSTEIMQIKGMSQDLIDKGQGPEAFRLMARLAVKNDRNKKVFWVLEEIGKLYLEETEDSGKIPRDPDILKEVTTFYLRNNSYASPRIKKLLELLKEAKAETDTESNDA